MPRSPEILTEPVVHDDLLKTLTDYHDRFVREATPNSIHSPAGPVIPIGILGSVTDFIAYWQAIGPLLPKHNGDVSRAEHEATFAAAIAKIDGCDWTVYAENGYTVTVYDGMPAPVFTAVWADHRLGDIQPIASPNGEYQWYSEHGYWLGPSTGAWHPDIASLLAHHRERVAA